MSPNVFEINKDKIYKDICCGEFYAFYVKEKNVGPVKILQDQQMLGVTGPTGPVTPSINHCPKRLDLQRSLKHVIKWPVTWVSWWSSTGTPVSSTIK